MLYRCVCVPLVESLTKQNGVQGKGLLVVYYLSCYTKCVRTQQENGQIIKGMRPFPKGPSYYPPEYTYTQHTGDFLHPQKHALMYHYSIS